ncbi:MAG: hypothetical protein HZB67_03085 [Candidatus Aenigmarchaeota archaeon]|nr:hypothetical protein [Candidatus Aenigmarchaeota archaeon]
MKSAKKGISQYLAASTLVLIAIMTGVILSSWLPEISKKEAQKIENRTAERLLCERGSLTIAYNSVYYNCSSDCSAGTNHTLTLSLKNTGEIKLAIKEIILINKTGTSVVLVPNLTSLDISELKTIGNVSRESCGGINRTIDEIMVTTSCTNVYDTYQGSDIIYQSC